MINYKNVGWDTTKFVNPTNMNQMDNGIKAACDGVDKLSKEKRFFFGLDSVGMALTNTLQEVYNAMPDNSMLKVYVSNGSESVVFQQSLPVYSAGEVIIYRGTSARGYIQFLQDNNGDMWRNNYYSSTFQGWDRFALNSNLESVSSILSGKANIIYGTSSGFQDLKNWVLLNATQDTPIRIMPYEGYGWSDCPLGGTRGLIVSIGISAAYGYLVLCIPNGTKQLYWNTINSSSNWSSTEWSILT